jgi:colanic acid/amylovoran biosynthesis glycosyltransferase
MKSQLIGLGFPESGLRIVRFGLDMEEYPVLEGERNPNNLMMVGRLVEKKGFEYGLRAVAESRKHGHHWNVNIFGDGPLMDSLQKLTNNLGLASSVRFHGFLPADAVLKAHRDHSLLLAPSVTASDGDMEGLPNTILEAMALGTPVIATNHAAIPEAITHTKSGFLARERDTGGLADILNKIASGQFNLNDIQKNARTVVEQHYNIQKMTEEVESVYGRVLSAKTS